MNDKPRWTIAVPTFNGQTYLAETMRSVMGQSDQDFELVVCDDGSNDGTLTIVQEVCGGRAHIFANESGRPLGLAGNWNRCVEKATGDWVTILHQDDLLEPDFLAVHREFANLNADVGLVTGPAPLVDSEGKPISDSNADGFLWPYRYTVWPPHALSRVLAVSNPLRCPSTSMRRELHQRLGGFDGTWKYVVDWDFWYRIGQIAPVALVGRPLAHQRWHSASETQRLARGTVDLEENSRIMRRILAGEPFADAERPSVEKSIRRRMAQAWFSRAYAAARSGDRRLEAFALRCAITEDRRFMVSRLIREPRTLARLILGNVGMRKSGVR